MDEESFRWRYQGAILTRETFQAQLWRGVLCQFVVSTVKSGRPIGFVISYRADLNAGHAYLGGMMTREARRTGIGLEAFSLFIRYIRRTWNINKLYVEFPDFNSPQFASGLISEAKEEARIRDHLYFDGQFWDYRYFSISG
jgi:RimJ/RimL family protein N-acetyltransferase